MEFKNEYYFTPLESLVINKLMPKGFKLEEESILMNNKEKSPIIEIKNLRTKEKKYYNNLINNNNKNFCRNFFKNNNNNNIQNKLLSIINSIKEIIFENKNFSLFNNDLILFEKDILNNKFKSIEKFYLNFEKNFIQKYSSKDFDFMNNLKTKIELQIDDLNKIKNNQIDENKNKNYSIKEKSELANLIRSISEKQLKGIINLLEEKDLIKKEGYYELDLENIDNAKLNEIDIYVRRCRRSPSYDIPISYKGQFKKKKLIF
jgi:hypothetical protein